MSQRAPSLTRDASRASVVHTTLLSLVQTLTLEGHDEHRVCHRVVELLEDHRVVLTGTLRDQPIKREDLCDE
jgi:hypothetical protein